MSKHFNVSPDGEMELKITPDGIGSLEATTVVDRMKRAVELYGDRLALSVKRDDKWQTWTYKEYYEDVKAAAKSFLALGLKQHHSVAIIGFNSPEWFFSDLGAIFAGGMACGMYTTNGPEACKFVALDSHAQIIVVENDKQLQKILEIKNDLPDLQAIVQYTGTVDLSLSKEAIPVYSWSDFMVLGTKVADHDLGERMTAQKPGHCCTLIYTSGTTGNPKGVMCSHDNATWTAQCFVEWCDLYREGKQEHIVSYLPLSHIAAQMVDIHGPIFLGAAVHFARPDALKGTLVQTLAEVRPTLFIGVPRVWEKMEEKMRAIGAETTGLKKKIATWAKRKGLEGSTNIMEGRKPPSGFGLANALVFKKIRKKLGLDRCRFMGTAAAPILKETLLYFMALNMPIYEIYGMSENTGPHTINRPGDHRLGSVGKPLNGVELLIDNPDSEGNGEICMRGRHVCMGYLSNEAKTKDTIDEDGWLHTGDVGRVDDQGYLHITGRIKELIITAGGENVAPVPIEDAIKTQCPFISNLMLIGDKRKFLSLIVTLKCEVDPETTEPKDEISAMALADLHATGSSATTVSEARQDDKVKAAIQAAIDHYNDNEAVSRAQRVQKFIILEQDFSVFGGELGPTLKLKRPVVHRKYEDVINSMYE